MIKYKNNLIHFIKIVTFLRKYKRYLILRLNREKNEFRKLNRNFRKSIVIKQYKVESNFTGRKIILIFNYVWFRQTRISDRKNDVLLFVELVRRHCPIVKRLLSRSGRSAIGCGSWSGTAQEIPKDRARIDS